MMLSKQIPLQHLLKLKKDKNYRIQNKSVIIEGTKLINELYPRGLIKLIITIDIALVPTNFPQDKLYMTTRKVIERITDLKQSEGILAEVHLPSYSSLLGKNKLLALDNIQDPGNFGTLLRSALAFGFEGVVLLNGGVDPFNDKALRSARGATFHLPMQEGGLEKFHDYPLYIADTKGEDPHNLPKQDRFILLLGNEAHGPSQDLIGTKISLKMHNGVESLNVAVAASILMYLL